MKKARNEFIAGGSGTGKSYELGRDIENLVLDEGYFVPLLDPKIGDQGRYGDHRGLSVNLNFVRVHVTKKVLKQKAREIKYWKRLLKKARSDGANGIRFTFESLQRGIDEYFETFIDTLSRSCLSMNGKVALAVEEAHTFAPHQSVGGSTKNIRGLIKLIDEGRLIDKLALLCSQKLHKSNTALYDSCQIYKLYPMAKSSHYEKVLSRKDHGDLIDEAVNWATDSRKQIYYNLNAGEARIKNVDGLSRRTPHVS